MLKCMRTNIVLDDELVREAMRYSKAKTKRALVEDALRTLVRVRTEENRRSSYQDRLVALRNRLAGLTFRESAVDMIRQDREGR
jgi:Arc/MetJ family transcription regulator